MSRRGTMPRPRRRSASFASATPKWSVSRRLVQRRGLRDYFFFSMSCSPHIITLACNVDAAVAGRRAHEQAAAQHGPAQGPGGCAPTTPPCTANFHPALPSCTCTPSIQYEQAQHDLRQQSEASEAAAAKQIEELRDQVLCDHTPALSQLFAGLPHPPPFQQMLVLLSLLLFRSAQCARPSTMWRCAVTLMVCCLCLPLIITYPSPLPAGEECAPQGL